MSEKINQSVVKFKEKMGFATFSCSVNILFAFRSSYYKYFLTSILLIDPNAVGTMMVIGSIWDIVNDPLIGVWVNNIKFKNGEKIRPIILGVAVPYALGLVLLFTDFGFKGKGTIIAGIVAFFIYEIANTFRGIPYNGMGAVASSNDEDRKAINGYRSFGGALGTAIGTLTVPLLVKLFGGLADGRKVINSSDKWPLFKAACFMGVIIIIGCLIHYFTTKERVKQVEETDEKTGFIETYKILFKCKSWVMNMMLIACYGVITSLCLTYITYYANYVLNNGAAATPIQAAYLVVTLVTSLLAPKIDKLLGRKKTMVAACLIQIIGKIPFMLNYTSVVAMYINAATMGMGLTTTYVLMNTNRNNITDIIEVQSHKRLDTMVATGDTLASKIAETMADKMTMAALAAAGFNAALANDGLMQNMATQNTICSFLGWVPCVFAIVLMVCALMIDTDKEMRESLAARQKEVK